LHPRRLIGRQEKARREPAGSLLIVQMLSPLIGDFYLSNAVSAASLSRRRTIFAPAKLDHPPGHRHVADNSRDEERNRSLSGSNPSRRQSPDHRQGACQRR
jgi:hypothetical protein